MAGGVTIRSFNVMGTFIQLVQNALNCKKKLHSCEAPCDSTVLRLHYKTTFWVMMFVFAATHYCFFYKDIIRCYSQYNADVQIRPDYTNICLSYPFVEEKDGSKRSVMFYRWMHWIFLVVAFVYLIPKRLSNKAENSKLQNFFDDICLWTRRPDLTDDHVASAASIYIVINNKSNNKLFYRYLAWHFIALLLNIAVFFSFDAILQHRFANLVPESFPFNRDPRYFTDYISQTFPPFVRCEITPSYKLTLQRTERLSCHLYVMELYEKFFIFLWFWMILLAVVTALYLLYMMLFFNPLTRNLLLMYSKPFSSELIIRQTISEVVKRCEIGDWFLLYRLRHLITPLCYYKLMEILANSEKRNETLLLLNQQQSQIRNRSRCYSDEQLQSASPRKSLLIE